MSDCLDTISVPIETIKQTAETYPDSYFTRAISFAELQKRKEIEVSVDALRYIHLADTDQLVEHADMFAIDKDMLAKTCIRCALKLYADSPEIVKNYIPELTRLHMYKEFQEYVLPHITNYFDYPMEFVMSPSHRTKEHNNNMLIEFTKAKNTKYAMAFIEKHSDQLDYYNNNGVTALMVACRHKLSDIALAILAHGGKPEHACNRGNTALMEACYNKLSDVVMAILSQKCNLNQSNGHGDTALSVACKVGASDIALAILAHGGNPDHVDVNDCTPLMAACYKSMVDVAIAILARGGKPEQFNKQGRTALMVACERKMSQVALAILQAGGNPDYVNDYGDTALIIACENNMPEVALAILKHGGKPEQKNKWGKTAEGYAIDNNMVDVVSVIRLNRVILKTLAIRI